MKYIVEIPNSKSDRMNKCAKVLVISKSDGWGIGSVERIVLGPEVTEYIFEISDEYEDIDTTNTLDGPIFQTTIEFTNSTGSRKEVYKLQPKRYTEDL